MKLAEQYFSSIDEPPKEIASFHFCDNEMDANECSKLVLAGEKRATSSCLWSYELFNEDLPCVNDLSVITDWDGNELCVIRTDTVKIVPFDKVDAAFAALEGEGDKSIEYWRRVHWAYFKRELFGSKYEPLENMPIVCETFSVVFQS